MAFYLITNPIFPNIKAFINKLVIIAYLSDLV